jgi:hypothetical protein
VIEITVNAPARRNDEFVMPLARRFSLPTHGAIEFISGVVLMLAPALLPLGVAGMIVTVSLGAIQAGMGLRLTTDRDPTSFWHRHYDSVFVLVTAVAALALAAAGRPTAAILLIALVGIQSCLNLLTRYVTTA